MSTVEIAEARVFMFSMLRPQIEINVCMCACMHMWMPGSYGVLFYDGFKKTIQAINLSPAPTEQKQSVSILRASC